MHLFSNEGELSYAQPCDYDTVNTDEMEPSRSDAANIGGLSESFCAMASEVRELFPHVSHFGGRPNNWGRHELG